MRILVLSALLLLAACDVNALGDQAKRKAAESVVQPVMNVDMPAPVAAKATDCVLDNASHAEIEALARDVGVEAGTLTIANIRKIAARPATQACFAASGVPPLKG
jgi:hypothetical protein